MLTIRCFKCGWAWSMNAAEVAAALDAMHAEQRTRYYMAECPKCRRANKVPYKQLRRNAPRDWSPPPADQKTEAGTDTKTQAAPKTVSKPRPKTTPKQKTDQ